MKAKELHQMSTAQFHREYATMADGDWREVVAMKFSQNAEEMRAMRGDLKTNTEATERIETSIAGILEAFNSLKGAFKVFEFIGRAAKPLAAIAAACVAITAIYNLIVHGTPRS